MKARVIQPRELGPDHLRLWNEFREADPVYHSPFYAPQFTGAVARLRDDARVALLEQDGEIVGFLPFHFAGRGVGKPIGGHINDYQGPILAPGMAIPAEHLLRGMGLFAYDYNHLPMQAGVIEAGAHSFLASPQMDLSGYHCAAARKGASWSRMQATIRRNLRKTERELGPIRFAFHDPSHANFRDHVAMINAQYRQRGVRADFGQGWAGALIDALRNTDEPDFAGVMSTLYAGDRLIAAHFGIRSRDVLHWWFPTFDQSAGHVSPGISLLDACARAAEDHGVSTLDFGSGTERYKLRFADRFVALGEGSMVRPGNHPARLRQVSRAFVTLAARLPLGWLKDYPRRAVARYISGVMLPPHHGASA